MRSSYVTYAGHNRLEVHSFGSLVSRNFNLTETRLYLCNDCSAKSAIDLMAGGRVQQEKPSFFPKNPLVVIHKSRNVTSAFFSMKDAGKHNGLSCPPGIVFALHKETNGLPYYPIHSVIYAEGSLPQDKGERLQIISSATENCLCCAMEMNNPVYKIRSIAMPVFGSPVDGLALEEKVPEMVLSAVRFFKNSFLLPSAASISSVTILACGASEKDTVHLAHEIDSALSRANQ